MGLEARILALSLRLGLGIWALGLGLRPLSCNLGWDLDLKAGIWASWLRFGPRG